jgi:hypothetical protein
VLIVTIDPDSPKRLTPNPHPLDRGGNICHLEAHSLAHLEVGDESCHAPVVELAAAYLQVVGEFLFGDQFEFDARRGWVLRCCGRRMASGESGVLRSWGIWPPHFPAREVIFKLVLSQLG